MLQISTSLDTNHTQLTVDNADLTYTLPGGGIGHITVNGKINGLLIDRDLTAQEMTDFIAGTPLVLDIPTETNAAHNYLPDDFYVVQLTVLVSGTLTDTSNQTCHLSFIDIEKSVGDKIVSTSLYPGQNMVRELHEYQICLTGLQFLGSNPASSREGEAVTRISYLTLKLSGS